METLERHERKLQEDKSWKLILEELSSGIVIIDKSKTITYSNPSTLNIIKKIGGFNKFAFNKAIQTSKIKDLLFNSTISLFQNESKQGILSKVIN